MPNAFWRVIGSRSRLNRVLNVYGQFAIFKRRRQRRFVKRGAWNKLGGRTPPPIGNGSGWQSVEGRNCFLEVINIVPRTAKMPSAELTFWPCWWKEGYEVELFLFQCSYSPELKVVNPSLMGHDTWKRETSLNGAREDSTRLLPTRLPRARPYFLALIYFLAPATQARNAATRFAQLVDAGGSAFDPRTPTNTWIISHPDCLPVTWHHRAQRDCDWL